MENSQRKNCLICLNPSEFLRDLFEATYIKLLAPFYRLLGFEINIEGGVFNVCNDCEIKLNYILDFQIVCEKSLAKYRSIDCKKELETDENISLIVKEEAEHVLENQNIQFDSRKKLSIRRQSGRTREMRMRKFSESDARVLKVRKRIGKSKRCQQFPEIDVLRAIEETANYITDMKNRQCLYCEDVASSAITLRMHMGGKHKDAFKMWCKYCNLQTDNLADHQRIENCNEIRCNFCNIRCINSNRLSGHLRTHCLNRYPMAKEIIDRKKNVDINRAKAKIKSDFYKKYLCPICGKIYKTSAGLASHISSHNCEKKSDEKRFKCSTCGKSLHSASALGTHKKRHKGIMAFVCPICGKGSFDNGAHKKHLEIHETGPVHCPVCDKQCQRPGLLKIHMRQHTGENQYHCIPCGKSFPVKSMLQSHLVMHNDDRPHECTFCRKGFKDEGTRRKHERIHTGSKPFKCSICSFKCVQAQGLTVHMKQHPEDAPLASKPHKCLFCYRSFSTNALLLSHNDFSHKNHDHDSQ